MTEAPDLLKREGSDETGFGRILEVQIDQKRLRLTLARLLDKGHGLPALHEQIVVHQIEELRIFGIRDDPLPAPPHACHGRHALFGLESHLLAEELR